MSQFSTMTTRDRKIQAAAICREIQGPEDIEIDLGRKVNAPKDIMYEELSLTSNRGSRLFKMRQKRSEKYTFESIQNVTNTQTNNGVEVQAENGTENQEPPKTPPNTPDTRMVPDPESIAPGYGGPLKDIPPEKFNSTSIPKSYHSPWDQAINNDPELANTLGARMAEPEPRREIPGYKSFNRVATPFGGFGKAPRPTLIKDTQLDPICLPDYAELQGDSVLKRTSFNRTALGWMSMGTPDLLPMDSLEAAIVPESDDL